MLFGYKKLPTIMEKWIYAYINNLIKEGYSAPLLGYMVDFELQKCKRICENKRIDFSRRIKNNTLANAGIKKKNISVLDIFKNFLKQYKVRSHAGNIKEDSVSIEHFSYLIEPL